MKNNKKQKYTLNQLLTDTKVIGLNCFPGFTFHSILFEKSHKKYFSWHYDLLRSSSPFAQFTAGSVGALSFVGLILYGFASLEGGSLNPYNWKQTRIERKKALDSSMIHYSNKRFIDFDINNSKTLDSTEFLKYYLKDRNHSLGETK